MHLTDPKSPPADEQTASSDEPTDDLTIPAFLKRQDSAEPEKANAQEDEMSKKTANAAEAKVAKPKKARTPAKAKDARKTAPRPVKAAAKPKAVRKAQPNRLKRTPEQVADTLNKLVRLSKSSNRHEAWLARARALKLIRKYGLPVPADLQPKQPKAAQPPKEAKAPRTDTKSAQLEAMLRSAKGTTIAEVIEAFGWLPHTARAAISAGIGKKRGLTIVSEKDEKRGRVYRGIAA